MEVLLVNDDGIFAKGLQTLAEYLSREHNVTVVAPDREQSAVGHAITLANPVRITEIARDGKLFGYATNGTPADCVKLALRVVLNSKPDFVVSGINHGANVGSSLLYSGTVSAATEATLLGIPSLAVSLDSKREDADFSHAAEITARLLKNLATEKLPTGILLNVNVPSVAREKIAGTLITVQSRSYFDDYFDRRIDPQGKTYYWMTGAIVEDDCNLADGHVSDVAALRQSFVSITPIQYDLTAYNFLSLCDKFIV